MYWPGPTLRCTIVPANGAGMRVSALRMPFDVYRMPTIEQADMSLVIKPGTDAALALAVMNVLITEGLVDRGYLARYTDFDAEAERHILSRTPQWASGTTGPSVEHIVA